MVRSSVTLHGAWRVWCWRRVGDSWQAWRILRRLRSLRLGEPAHCSHSPVGRPAAGHAASSGRTSGHLAAEHLASTTEPEGRSKGGQGREGPTQEPTYPKT